MRSKNHAQSASKDSKKEKIYKLLCEILADAGYVIRREELKRGFGWKVVSGTCRLNDDKIIFVDRRMSQEDQVSFLTAKMVTLQIVPSQERTAQLVELGCAVDFLKGQPALDTKEISPNV